MEGATEFVVKHSKEGPYGSVFHKADHLKSVMKSVKIMRNMLLMIQGKNESEM